MIALRIRRRSAVSDGTVTFVTAAAWFTALLLYSWAIWTRSQNSCNCTQTARKSHGVIPYTNDDCDPTRRQLWAHQGMDSSIIPLVKAGSVTGAAAHRTEQRASALDFYGRYVGEERLDQLLYEWFFRNDAGTAERQGRFVEIRAAAFGRTRMDSTDTLFFEGTLGWAGLIVTGRGQSADGEIRGRNTRIVEENLCVADGVNKTQSGCLRLGDMLEAIGLGTVDVMMVTSGQRAASDAVSPLVTVAKELNPEKILVRALAIELEEDDALAREALLKRGYCLVKRIDRIELWVGDSVFRRLYCGWTAFRHEP